MSKVTIELTSTQRDQIRKETGDDVMAFTWEKLESRDAPKLGGAVTQVIGTGGVSRDVPLTRLDGVAPIDPAT